MTIYLDVIWLLNFVFDLLLLLLTAIILKRRIIKWKVIVGAFIGSTIVLLYFTPFQAMVGHPFVKLLYSILIVYVAFGFHKFRTFFKNLFTFYFVTFTVGGGLLGIHYFFQTEFMFMNGVMATSSGGFGDPVSWLFVIVGFPIIWYFSKKNIDDVEVKKIHYDQLANVEIQVDDKVLSVRGLIDSGNQLYDPITKTPVMIIDMNKTKSFFPESIQKSRNIEEFNWEEHELEWSHRLRLIPYRAVGQDHQFLLAVKPDKVTIHTNEETITTQRVFIGLNDTPLSSEDEYECIIHPKMLLDRNHISA
ncbi:sigma-E processing peptidase SpoIIGA [Bacillus sp. Marseille-P3661]|uniref:sigma-E processing peptidase SpoIIGA n=1 Tax=Bacillus sp. Marseille-P3661 TaxID=1936234 RepID=UPI000C8447B3|nr:sigma-E processing peptidase SpoIIGA [Bacillus sp. Marseille-P3661]